MQIPATTLPGGAAVEASTPGSAKEALRAFKLKLTGHAIECRLCAEDPCNDLGPARCAATIATPAATPLPQQPRRPCLPLQPRLSQLHQNAGVGRL